MYQLVTIYWGFVSGETEKNVSGFTVDTVRETLRNEIHALRELINERDRRYEREWQAVSKSTEVAMTSAQKAVEKAEAAVERRLEGMNEFRGSLADQARLLMPRSEAESRMTEMSKQLAMLSSRIDRGEGRGSGLNQGWGYLIGAIGAIGGIIAIFFALSK